MRRWDDHSPECLEYKARVEPHDIALLGSLVSCHEELAILRTKDRALGIVEFWVAPAMRTHFEDFREGLKQEMNITWAEPTIINVAELGAP